MEKGTFIRPSRAPRPCKRRGGKTAAARSRLRVQHLGGEIGRELSAVPGAHGGIVACPRDRAGAVELLLSPEEDSMKMSVCVHENRKSRASTGSMNIYLFHKSSYADSVLMHLNSLRQQRLFTDVLLHAAPGNTCLLEPQILDLHPFHEISPFCIIYWSPTVKTYASSPSKRDAEQ
ncbi:hypothetical protein Q5P01_024299 [Channa striata]|uniref:Uncharacterized protein n=1 Tax=Channa striata TaxID=64152 RepID=A0AA88IL55_CHASR|nr:hypothetical protein Q5P01_024299 [Channa striata]